IMPTRKMLSRPIEDLDRASIAKKKPRRSGAFLVPAALSADHHRFLDDLRRHEDEQLGLVILLRRSLEQVAQDRNVSEERHLVGGGPRFLLEDPAEHDGVAVVDEDLRGHLAGVDRRYVARGAGVPELAAR